MVADSRYVTKTCGLNNKCQEGSKDNGFITDENGVGTELELKTLAGFNLGKFDIPLLAHWVNGVQKDFSS